MDNTDFTNLEKHVAEYVTGLYNSPDVPHYPYHNLQHTVAVVDHSKEIAAHYKLGAADTSVLVIAAWFHDVGHLYGPMPGHEARGVGIMREHLAGVAGVRAVAAAGADAGVATAGADADAGAGAGIGADAGVAADLLDAIGDCIMATKLPAHPVSLQHKIICDADTYHLGTTLFLQTDARVRQEVELRTGKTTSNWRQKTLDLLQQHQFFTDYCQALLKEGKAKNIAWLREQIGQQ